MTSFRSKVNQFVMNSALVISGVVAAVLPVVPASAADYYGANDVQPPAPVNFENRRTFAPVGHRNRHQANRAFRRSNQEACYVVEANGSRTYVACSRGQSRSFGEEYARRIGFSFNLTDHVGRSVETRHSHRVRWTKGITHSSRSNDMGIPRNN
ncbi:MAG: hypothetical protein PHD48_02185 [Alphaproteobacteria bacterium]|nr:hypothetical protein [Alphaproteobacteria bacterium]